MGIHNTITLIFTYKMLKIYTPLKTVINIIISSTMLTGARGGAVGLGTALQA